MNDVSLLNQVWFSVPVDLQSQRELRFVVDNPGKTNERKIIEIAIVLHYTTIWERFLFKCYQPFLRASWQHIAKIALVNYSYNGIKIRSVREDRTRELTFSFYTRGEDFPEVTLHPDYQDGARCESAVRRYSNFSAVAFSQPKPLSST